MTERGVTEAELRALFDATPLAMILLEDLTVVGANREAELLLERSEADLRGTDALELVASGDRDFARSRYDAKLRGQILAARYLLELHLHSGRRVVVEVEPRILTPRQTLLVLRDRSLRRRDVELLVSLTDLASRLQRVRSIPALLHAATQALFGLGLQVTFYRLVDEDVLEVTNVAGPPEFLECMVRALGGPLVGHRMKADALPLARDALAEGRSLFLGDIGARARATFRAASDQDFAALTQMAAQVKVTRGVICPLLVQDKPWGLCTLSSDELQPADVSALSLFAAQLASTMEATQAIEGLERKNRDLAAVQAVAASGSATNLELLIPELLRLAAQTSRSDRSSYYQLDAALQEVRLVQVYGDALDPSCRPLIRYEGSHLEQAVQRKQPLVFARPSPLHPPGAPADPHGACLMVVPIATRGAPFGAIYLMRSRGPRYTDDEVHSASILAGQIAIQLENARLYEERRRQVLELALINEVGGLITQHLELTEVITTAERNLCQMLAVQNVFLFLLEPDGLQLRLVATSLTDEKAWLGELIPANPPSIPWAAVLEGRPVVANHVREDPRVSPDWVRRFGHEAEFSVPLMVRGKPVGAVLLGETRSDRKFTLTEVERAVAVTNHLSTAFANAKLYEAERRRVEELQLFLDLSHVVTATLELGAILESSSLSLARVVDATDAFIWLVDEQTQVLHGAAASSPDLRAAFLGARAETTGPSLASRVVRTSRAIQMNRVENDQEVHELNLVFGLKSLLGIPLIVRDTTIGAVVLADRHRPRVWSEGDLAHVSAMAGQVSVAVTNSRLYEHLKSSYHELEQAQKAVVKRERLAALGEVSAVMAHEVRNPLGVIFNALGSLQKILRPTGDAALLLKMLGEEADRLNRIVGDLLDFARPNEPELRLESVEELLQGALEAAQRIVHEDARSVQVEMHVDPALPLLRLDAQMMRQALVNLILNAMQAMAKEGGTLKLTAAPEGAAPAAWVRLSVEDSGPGIETSTNDRLFQPFFTTKASGTGLGLSVVKRIVEAHRGEVFAEPRTPRGTVFVVRLPVQPE